MSNDVKRLLEGMRINRRSYWTATEDPKILAQLLCDFTKGSDMPDDLVRSIRDRMHMPPAARFAEIFEQRLAVPETFPERAAWTIFWAVASACDDMAQAAHSTDNEPELNGALLKAIEGGCKQFRPPETGKGESDCIAVALLNLAKLGNEAVTGADFGIVVEIEVGKRTSYLVSHVQAKRARSRQTSVHRAAGEATQLNRLMETGYGRYLFYNQHDEPKGLMPTTISAELVNHISLGGTRPVDSVDFGSDFAANLAAAVLIGAGSARENPDGRTPWAHGYGYTDNLIGAVDLLYPVNDPDLAVSQLIVARIGERRFTPQDVHELARVWHDAVEHRAIAAHSKGMQTDLGPEELPPLID